LSLQAAVLREPELTGLEHGDRSAPVVPECGEAFADRLAIGKLLEVAESNFVLGGDPRHGVWRIKFLEPAVRIGDLAAEVVVDDVDLAGGWIGEDSGGRRGRYRCRSASRR